MKCFFHIGRVVRKYEIEAIHPDDFICHLIDLSPESILDSINNQLKSLKNPTLKIEDLIKTHKKKCSQQEYLANRNYVRYLNQFSANFLKSK